MIFAKLALIAVSCLMAQQPTTSCMRPTAAPVTIPAAPLTPRHTGDAVDVILTAHAAIVWDLTTGYVVYEKNADVPRPIASLSKLLSALTIRHAASLDQTVEISSEATAQQRRGAHIRLPQGHHATVKDLLAASLIPSANDAMVAATISVADSEAAFITHANTYGQTLGLTHTKLANATGLSGGEQYSTARDVKTMLTRAYADPTLREFLSQPEGTLTTTEGTARHYQSTNKLLKTYLPIDAAKTGYTPEAGENLAIITSDAQGRQLGAVVLGSEQRFQDMKVLVEWIWRNYTWPNS